MTQGLTSPRGPLTEAQAEDTSKGLFALAQVPTSMQVKKSPTQTAARDHGDRLHSREPWAA